MAERLQRGGAVAELLAGALRQSCWQGRCSRAAGRECHGKEDGRGAVVKMLLPGRSIGKREKQHREEEKAASEKNMHLACQMNNI